MDHLQRWSRIFRSEETETDLSIWIPIKISEIFGIMESTHGFHHLVRSRETEVDYPIVNLFKNRSQSLSTKWFNANLVTNRNNVTDILSAWQLVLASLTRLAKSSLRIQDQGWNLSIQVRIILVCRVIFFRGSYTYSYILRNLRHVKHFSLPLAGFLSCSSSKCL